MSEPTTTFDQDLQASSPEVTIGLSRAPWKGRPKAVFPRADQSFSQYSSRTNGRVVETLCAGTVNDCGDGATNDTPPLIRCGLRLLTPNVAEYV